MSSSYLSQDQAGAINKVFLSLNNDDAHAGFANQLFVKFYGRGVRVLQSKATPLEALDPSGTKEDPIEISRVSVVVFSPEYMRCRWCLDELVKIVECRRRNGQFLILSFYRLNPSQVLELFENYVDGFATHGGCFPHDLVATWRAALEEASLIKGIVPADPSSEAELVDKIVRKVCKLLSAGEDKNLIGISSRINQVISLLCVQSLDVRIIGIWGMGGIGKTVLAEAVFNRISGEYENCCFMRNFSEQLRRKGENHMREKFFSKIVGKGLEVSFVKQSFVKEKIRCQKLLVVLDDVRSSGDVESLVGRLDWFGAGSRIIIISRDRRVLVQCQAHDIYKVEELNEEDSLQLFSHYAFLNNQPEVDLKHSIKVIKYCNGLPLALTFYGSELCCRGNRKLETISWEFRCHPVAPIINVLKSSYDVLNDNEKSIFLDLACFFRDANVDHVTELLDACGFFMQLGISSLIDKSLIAISDNRVTMHNFIQELGQELVCREATEPGKRSRLWDPLDIGPVLAKAQGKETVEGIFLDASALKVDLSPAAFEHMYKLRLLKIHCSGPTESCGVHVSQGLGRLPDQLRLLHWESYPFNSVPHDFGTKNLVELNLPQSNIKKLWKKTKHLEKLKKIRLCHSKRLVKIPKLSNARNLEHVDLEGCISLERISSSIHNLDKLAILNLKDCSKLQSLPTLIHLKSLDVLNLSGCSNIADFPEVSVNVKELNLGGTAIREVPHSIKHLSRLVKLDLSHCRRLESLPTSICKLKCLMLLNLYGCLMLEKFPDIQKAMRSLECLDLRATAIKELPHSISYLIGIQKVRLDQSGDYPKNLIAVQPLASSELSTGTEDFLPSSVNEGQVIRELSFVWGSIFNIPFIRFNGLVDLSLRNMHISEIPKAICLLSSLKFLDVCGNGFKELRLGGSFLQLQILKVCHCKRLQLLEIPINLEYLNAHGSISLRDVLTLDCRNIRIGIFSNCFGLNPNACHKIWDMTTKCVASRGKAKGQLGSLSRNEERLLMAPLFSYLCFAGFYNPLHGNLKSSHQITIRLPNSREAIWGFELSVLVAFNGDPIDREFGIRCISYWKMGKSPTVVERVFHCLSKETAQHVKRVHVFVFYDSTMYNSATEGGGGNPLFGEVEFQFFPVNSQSESSMMSCTVRTCAVNVVSHRKHTTAEGGDSVIGHQKRPKEGGVSVAGHQKRLKEEGGVSVAAHQKRPKEGGVSVAAHQKRWTDVDDEVAGLIEL